MAIEMYELNQKKNEEKLCLNKLNVVKNSSNTQTFNSSNGTENNWKMLRSKILPEDNHHLSNMLYNMISGEILKPQRLENNCSPTNSIIVNDTKCDKKDRIDFNGFLNDDSSPFDNVELQSIDDKTELNKVFGALNTEKTNFTVPSNSPTQSLDDNNKTINTNANIQLPSTSNNYFGFYNCFPQPNNYDNQIPGNFKTGTNIPMLYNSASSSYSPNFNSPTHIPYSNVISNQITGNFQPQTYNPYPMNMYCYDQNMAYTFKNINCDSLEHKYSFDPNGFFQKNLRSKSVSDLSKIPPCNLNDENANNYLSDRSKTPPTLPSKFKTLNQNDEISKTNSENPLKLEDPYDTLTEKQKQFADRFCQMGFQRDRISRAVKHMDINNEKQIFDYLFALQQLEDKGYNCYEIEIALHFNNYDKNQVCIPNKLPI